MKVGDKVKHIIWGKGIIRVIRHDHHNNYGIEFDNEVRDGHDLNGLGKSGHCKWCSDYTIRKLTRGNGSFVVYGLADNSFEFLTTNTFFKSEQEAKKYFEQNPSDNDDILVKITPISRLDIGRKVIESGI
ncbi:MAG: hypothetical protein ACTSYG_08535 [Candidatus Heimdallarchaeota archaeon]